jgi:hypothetical protein
VGVEVLLYSSIPLALGAGELSASRHDRSNPGNRSRYPLQRMQLGFKRGSGRFEKERGLLGLPYGTVTVSPELLPLLGNVLQDI